MNTITIDGKKIPFENGQTIMQAATAADVYIPHLCYHPDVTSHGSCRVCLVELDGCLMAACTTPAQQGQEIISQNSPALTEKRKRIVQMLFIEGNHFCPSCEQSGQCQLQALAYDLEMHDLHYDSIFPQRKMDATHKDIILDHDRCIFCELCHRASEQIDKKAVFSLGGRGARTQLLINTPSNQLGDSDLSKEDRAAHICPVGVFIPREDNYPATFGERLYDNIPIRIIGNRRVEDKEERNE